MAFTGTSNELVKITNLKTDVLSLKDNSIVTNVNVDTETLVLSLIQEIENLKSIVANVQNPIKVGTIVPFAGEALSKTDHSAIIAPDGYEWCFGQIVSKTDEKYSALYSVIGDYWNTSDTLTDDQFQLPDLRNCFLRGCPEYNEEDASSNRSVGDFQQNGVPNINASWFSDCIMLSYEGDTTGAVRPTFIENYNLYNLENGAGNVIHKKTFNASWVSSVYKDGLKEVRPDNKTVNYLIKL